MKVDTHPKYYDKMKVTCSCGTSFTVGSTEEKLDIEVCSACHPFYTGKGKLVDTAGRVERYRAKREARESSVRGSRTARKEKNVKRRETRAERERKIETD